MGHSQTSSLNGVCREIALVTQNLLGQYNRILGTNLRRKFIWQIRLASSKRDERSKIIALQIIIPPSLL